MPKIDKGAIRRGMPLVGGAFPGSLWVAADPDRPRTPVTYGARPPKLEMPSLAPIAARIDALREKVEQVAATLRKARQQQR